MKKIMRTLAPIALLIGCATDDDAFYDLTFAGDPELQSDWDLYSMCLMEAEYAESALLPEWALALPPALKALRELREGGHRVANVEEYVIGFNEQHDRIIVSFTVRPRPGEMTIARPEPRTGELVTVNYQTADAPDWFIAVEKNTYDILLSTVLSDELNLHGFDPQRLNARHCDRVMVRTPVCIDPADSAQFRPLTRMPQRVFSCRGPDVAFGCCRS